MFLRDLRSKNVEGFEARLRAAQQAGELPAEASPGPWPTAQT
ncbi:hypothetical protein AB0D54_32815 [Streptomyces xanthophaeus]